MNKEGMSFQELFGSEPGQRGVPVVILNVKLSQAKVERLVVYSQDIPQKAVNDFILENGIDGALEGPILSQVIQKISDIAEGLEQDGPSLYAESEPTTSSYENSGERLYRAGLMQKQRSLIKSKVLRNREAQREEEQLTFRPQLTLTNKSTRSRLGLRTHKPAQVPYREEELRDCSFVPRINPNSRRLTEKRNPQKTDRFTALYNEASARKSRSELRTDEFYSSQCTFRPQISTYEPVPCPPTLKPSYSLAGPSTEALFSPRTGRAPHCPRNTENLPIGHYLYSQTQKAPVQVESPFHAENALNQRSQKLLLQVKIHNYFEIFSQLNGEDGQIHGESLSSVSLSPEVLRIMTPLLSEISKWPEPISFEGFVESMEKLFLTLSPAEKTVFYIRSKPREEESVELARKSTGSTGPSLYDRGLQHSKSKQEKLDKQKELIVTQEAAECTFQPQVVPYKRLQLQLDSFMLL